MIIRIGYFEIYWEIEEIILFLMVLVDLLKKHLLSVLVWNVLYHYRGAAVLQIDNIIDIQLESLRVFGLFIVLILIRRLSLL